MCGEQAKMDLMVCTGGTVTAREGILILAQPVFPSLNAVLLWNRGILPRFRLWVPKFFFYVSGSYLQGTLKLLKENIFQDVIFYNYTCVANIIFFLIIW
jgi:hypothetical protein